ncbi:molybdenum cofactor biosynthesis protein MoaE [Pseudalkalibacillus hwajinpoensis]|uniref:molybdenum cofactor biosynthesis protein MoaE n=1 Tax=Guptibacillus hwajinpoensis TaxID=208199 RepID=UPI001CD71894|nr:molybdenum cofactor biosynthesis protein MoaE [Pseudalkalibacillus hwajinpoensis]MCA0989945.1 molybdenum cofactor biosynthesis protein MoaE [Pseudalkalibacillus hwajinpoensis]
MEYYKITSEEIDVNQVITSVIRPEAGAINTFIGTVREFTGEKQTVSLQYEAYPSMAEKQLKRIGIEIREQWPNVQTSIVHRIGKLAISDIAVVIAVASPHRAESYEASRYAIERIKEIVPIWKKEYWTDGQEWIGDQLENTAYKNGAPKEEKE